jgi:hypothetical protein
MEISSPTLNISNLFSLDPPEKLYFEASKIESPAIIKIKNTSDSDVAFKVKSNAPKFYLVSPSRGVVKIGQVQHLKVNLRGQKIEENHSFMILGQKVDENSNLDKIWQGPKNFQKSKLRVCLNTFNENNSLETLNEENSRLEESLSEVIEELKTCRIKTLKHNCEHDREFSYLHGILTFASGVFFGLVFPVFFN